MAGNATTFDASSTYVPLSLAHLLAGASGWELGMRVVYAGVLPMVGCGTNLVALVLLGRSSLLGSWTYRMVAQLVLTDLLFCVLMAGVMFAPVLMERWPYGEGVCRAVMAVGILLPGVTLCSFLFTSLQRYMAIVHNKADLRVFSTRWQPFILASIWVVLLITILPFVLHGDAYVLYWPDLCFILPHPPFFATLRYTIVTLVTFGSAVTLLVYLLIFFRLRSLSNAQGAAVRARQRHIFGLFYVYLTFAGNFIPIVVWTGVGPEMGVESQRTFHLIAWGLCMACLAVNPLIYALVFRDVRRLYPCFRRRGNAVGDTSAPNANTIQTLEVAE